MPPTAEERAISWLFALTGQQPAADTVRSLAIVIQGAEVEAARATCANLLTPLPCGHPRACLVTDFYERDGDNDFTKTEPNTPFCSWCRSEADVRDKALMLSNLKARLDEQCEHWSSTHGGRDDRIDCLEEQIRKAGGPDIGEPVAGLAQDIHHLRSEVKP